MSEQKLAMLLRTVNEVLREHSERRYVADRNLADTNGDHVAISTFALNRLRDAKADYDRSVGVRPQFNNFASHSVV